jgi:hypothetical protein
VGGDLEPFPIKIRSQFSGTLKLNSINSSSALDGAENGGQLFLGEIQSEGALSVLRKRSLLMT